MLTTVDSRSCDNKRPNHWKDFDGDISMKSALRNSSLMIMTMITITIAIAIITIIILIIVTILIFI